MITRCIITVLLVFGGVCFQIGAEAPQQTRLQILTPSFQGRETGSIQLENGLEAYLISDPKASKSAAALCVHVGTWDNPEEAMGMAHFVEHMLFLGTEEYPEEGAFQQFVVQNGGDYSAFTSSESTCYLFSIDSGAYSEGLNRLASFFKSPLFTESCTERELQAIQGEFSATTRDDPRRCHAVLRELSNPEHPNHRFGAGNRESLAHVSNQQLRKWYEEHYSANLMRLIVYSPLPLTELQEMVKKDFSTIRNHQLEWNPPQVPILTPAEGKIAYVQSIKDKSSLTLDWEIPAALIKLDSKPEDIASYILSHEGPHGISAHLKDLNLATNLAAGCYHWGAQNYIFRIQVDLTQNGLENIDTVVERCFAGIHALNQGEIPEYLYNDRRRMAELQYQYQQRSDPFALVSRYVWMIFEEGLDTFPELSEVIQRFDPEGVKEVLNQLTPERVFLTVNTNLDAIGKKADRTEKWLIVDYTVEPIAEMRLQAWREAQGYAFELPRANQWLPQNLKLIGGANHSQSSESPVPLVVLEEDGGRMHYCQDTEFEVPEVYCKLRIGSPELSWSDGKKVVLSDLYVSLLYRHLSQLAEETGLAGLHFGLGQEANALQLEVSGYSEKVLPLLEELSSSMRHLDANHEEFEAIRNKLLSAYRDQFSSSPLIQTRDMLNQIFLQEYCCNVQKVEAIQTVSLQDLREFTQAIYAKTYIEGLAYGNLSPEQAQKAYGTVRRTLGGEPWPLEEQRPQCLVDLPQDQPPYAVEGFTTHPHDAVSLVIQSTDATPQTRAAISVLGRAIDTPFFKRLRTEQQTAYALHSWSSEVEKQPLVFLALESSNYCADVVLSRFESFLESFSENLETIFSEAEFEGTKRALLTELETPAQNIHEMGSLLYEITIKDNGRWDDSQQVKAALETLSYKEFCRITTETLSRSNQRRLALIVRGKPGLDIPEPYQICRDPEVLKKGLRYRSNQVVEVMDGI